MNYFEIIQEVSKIYLGYTPSVFSDVSKKQYNLVKEAIKSAVKSIFTDKSLDFRRIKTTMATVDEQQGYENIYGNIDNIIVPYSSGSLYPLYYTSDYENIIIMSENTDKQRPTHYSIFGEEIILYPIPDAAYSLRIISDQDRWAKTVGSVADSSASGQKKLYVSSTEGFVVGNTITIEPNTPREETGVIYSITAAVTSPPAVPAYLTLVSNLTYTHAIASVIEYYKYDLTYQADAPNIPSKYHEGIVYKALQELYFDDAPAQSKYGRLFQQERKFMIDNSRGAKPNKPFFTFGG